MGGKSSKTENHIAGVKDDVKPMKYTAEDEKRFNSRFLMRGGKMDPPPAPRRSKDNKNRNNIFFSETDNGNNNNRVVMKNDRIVDDDNYHTKHLEDSFISTKFNDKDLSSTQSSNSGENVQYDEIEKNPALVSTFNDYVLKIK